MRFIVCPRCNGSKIITKEHFTGRLLAGKCPYCKGQGGFKVSILKKLCPSCKGSGNIFPNEPQNYEAIKCSKCKGKGTIMKKITEIIFNK